MFLHLVHLLPPLLAPIAPGTFTAKVDVTNTYGQSTMQMDVNHKSPVRHRHHRPHCHPPCHPHCNSHLLMNHTTNSLQVQFYMTLYHHLLLRMEDPMLMSTWSSNTPILIETRHHLVLILTSAKNQTETHHLGMVQRTSMFLPSVFLTLHVLLVLIILSSMVSRAFLVLCIYTYIMLL